MIPLELMMILLWGLFALVGLARKFPREFGATVAFVGMLFFFDLVGNRLGSVTHRLTAAVGLGWSEDLTTWLTISVIILLVVAIAYVGETLVFSGEWPVNRQGEELAAAIVDLTSGLINGWLVVGTWWGYAYKLGYPMQAIGWYVPHQSPIGDALVAFTPPIIIPEAYATWILSTALLALLALKFLR